MAYTLDEVKNNIRTKRQWTEQALRRLYHEQTSEERDNLQTLHRNNVGFNANDAPFLSSLARSLERYPHLTDKQLASAQKLLPKYARQLLELGKEQ